MRCSIIQEHTYTKRLEKRRQRDQEDEIWLQNNNHSEALLPILHTHIHTPTWWTHEWLCMSDYASFLAFTYASYCIIVSKCSINFAAVAPAMEAPSADLWPLKYWLLDCYPCWRLLYSGSSCCYWCCCCCCLMLSIVVALTDAAAVAAAAAVVVNWKYSWTDHSMGHFVYILDSFHSIMAIFEGLLLVVQGTHFRYIFSLPFPIHSMHQSWKLNPR